MQVLSRKALDLQCCFLSRGLDSVAEVSEGAQDGVGAGQRAQNETGQRAALCGLHPLLGHIHLPQHELLSGLQFRDLIHSATPGAAAGQPASPWSWPQASGEILSWCLEELLPPLSLTLVSAGLFSFHFLTPL